MSLNLSANYKLMNNVDCSETLTWNGGAGFKPIGTLTSSFNGSFSGQDYTISNLFINRTDIAYVGLFGRTSGASISNVHINESIINPGLEWDTAPATATHVGLLVGNSVNTLIKNSSARGDVRCYQYCGVLVGRTALGSISYSHSHGYVEGLASTAGFVGDSRGNISNSYSTADVRGRNTIGGFVGLFYEGSIAEILDSYATGNVYGMGATLAGTYGDQIGGFVGRIDNCRIERSYATGDVVAPGKQGVGGFIGVSLATEPVSDSYSTGSVEGYYNVGGFVGHYNSEGTKSHAILRSYSLSPVTAVGGERVGGFVGYNDQGIIYQSYSTGNVIGWREVGGFVGLNFGASFRNSRIYDSYATGEVEGTNRVAGFFARGDFADIRRSYSTGKVTGVTEVGGFGASIESINTFQDNFWDIETSEKITSVTGTGKSTTEMKKLYTFFDASWDIGYNGTNLNGGYPYLSWQLGSGPTWYINNNETEPIQYTLTINKTGEGTFTGNGTFNESSARPITATPSVGGSFVNWTGNGAENIANPNSANTTINLNSNLNITANFRFFAGGDGSPGDPYQIETWVHLNNTRLNLSASYVLMNNLSSATGGYSGIGNDWMPIGGGSNNFEGEFNGNGHTISNLVINKSGEGDVGLFGKMDGATISNIGLIDVEVNGGSQTGGLVGYFSEGSSINNSYVRGNVNGTNNVGGLVGNANYSDISNSYFRGSVTGGEQVGGLVGYANESTISDSYSTGSVTGSLFIGGLVGDADLSNISNSYSTGDVNGTNNVGGLVGDNELGAITNSYWYNSTVNSELNCSGNSEEDSCFTRTYLTYFYKISNSPMDVWDFENIWSNAYDGTAYPVFQWQNASIIEEVEEVEEETIKTSSYSPKTYFSDSKLPTEGNDFNLRIWDKIKFKVQTNNHTLTMQNFNSTHARVKIESDPIISWIEKGVLYEFDLNNDSTKDVRVKYNGMNSTSKQAMIFIQEIVPSTEESLISGEVVKGLDDEKSGFDWAFWLMLLLVLGIILWTVWYLFQEKIKDYLHIRKIGRSHNK